MPWDQISRTREWAVTGQPRSHVAHQIIGSYATLRSTVHLIEAFPVMTNDTASAGTEARKQLWLIGITSMLGIVALGGLIYAVLNSF
jgi:hypothetical protein